MPVRQLYSHMQHNEALKSTLPPPPTPHLVTPAPPPPQTTLDVSKSNQCTHAHTTGCMHNMNQGYIVLHLAPCTCIHQCLRRPQVRACTQFCAHLSTMAQYNVLICESSTPCTIPATPHSQPHSQPLSATISHTHTRARTRARARALADRQ